MENNLRKLILELTPCKIDLDYTNNLIRNNAILELDIPNRNTFIERSKNVEKLVYENYDIKHIVNYYKEKYGVVITEILEELIECHYYIMHIITNKESLVVSKFKNNKSNIEKTFIRLFLLKEGWKPYSIEKIIKRHYKVKYNIEKHKTFYFFINNTFKLDRKNFKIGRPLLPCIIKDLIKKKNNIKNKDKINKIYKVYYSINNLFTKEEINYLTEACKEDNIIKKLVTLKEFST